MYRWIDHTSEVEIRIEAGSEREVFEDALGALRDLLGFGSITAGSEQRTVAVSAPDRPALLAAWLEELVYLAESEGFVALRVERLALPGQEPSLPGDEPSLPRAEPSLPCDAPSLPREEPSLPAQIVDNFVDNRLRAVVAGVIDDPPPLVKAVTYHRLAFAPVGAGYVANVVLDV